MLYTYILYVHVNNPPAAPYEILLYTEYDLVLDPLLHIRVLAGMQSTDSQLCNFYRPKSVTRKQNLLTLFKNTIMKHADIYIAVVQRLSR